MLHTRPHTLSPRRYQTTHNQAQQIILVKTKEKYLSSSNHQATHGSSYPLSDTHSLQRLSRGVDHEPNGRKREKGEPFGFWGFFFERKNTKGPPSSFSWIHSSFSLNKMPPSIAFKTPANTIVHHTYHRYSIHLSTQIITQHTSSRFYL